MMYKAIVFLPIIGALIAGLIGRALGARPSEIITTLFVGISAVLSWVVFTLVVLTVAAAEAAIGLAILVVYFRNRGSIAVEDVNLKKG